MASPHLAEQVGRVLDGRYRIVAPIGTGASAAVYLADDTTLRRRVALKVLHVALAGDQGFLKRFQAEAHTAAALSHPNIMRVLDWGEAGDGPFLVLEYLGGGSLRSLLDQESTLSIEQAVKIGIQAARALDYAHRRGLVHRDIKPANLLLDDEGRIAIADFGLARALAEAAWTEPGGAVLGTARYASPEQVRGHSLDGKADVYSLGLVLFEAVCGYVPFSADTTIATLMARLDAHVEMPTELGLLAPIVQQALHPDPAERITAAVMLAQLEDIALKLPVPARVDLPGAITVDITSSAVNDPTMLPAPSEAPQAVSVQARPLPPENMPRAKKQRQQKQRQQKKRRIKLKRPSFVQVLVSIALVALVLGAGGGAYALYNFTGKQRPVPVLDGLTLVDARTAAKTADIKFTSDGEVFNETVPAGQTFDTNPPPGTKIYPRQIVHLKVSKGPAPRAVENFVGKTIEEAKAGLEAKDFKVTTENRSSETDPKGKVLEQTPNSGESDKGSEIKLVLSSGPAPRVIVDVKGKSYDDALSALTKQQLKVTRADAFSDDIPAGQVSGTSPGPGTSVERGSTVAVNVSKGPDLVVIPDVRGLTPEAASSKLTDAGFVANIFGDGGTVVTTKGAPGEKAKRGSVVKVFIG